jgi:DNA mismatch endonuclease, patch repair protein
MDTLAPEVRRRVMQANRGRTLPERAFASALWKQGARFLTSDGYRSRYGEALLGKPDIVFRRARLVVFVDGCFWHGCPQCGRRTKSHRAFWRRKIDRNRRRDRVVTRGLQRAGWQVVRIPEHSIKRPSARLEVANRLVRRILRTSSSHRSDDA